MDFVCARCDGKSFTTLRGWKRHMSIAHGGYDEADVAQALRGAGTPEDDVQQRMANFAASMPADDGEGGPAEPSGEAQQPSGERPATPPPPPPTRTIKATPKALKAVIGGLPEKIFESQGIELDDDDKKALEEAGEFLIDLFSVSFEVDQSKTVLKNRAWALLWIAGVCGVIYLKHKFKDVWQNLAKSYAEKKAADLAAAGKVH